MESPDRVDQRSDGDLVKNKYAINREDDEAIRNGYETEEGSKKTTNKRKASSSDAEEGIGGKRANTSGTAKVEDHARIEIPAHHARRPPNGFLLFCKRHRDIVSAKNPNLENRGVTKLLGNWWRTLEEDERDKYKELARQNKEIFIANNPQFTWYKLPAPPLRTLVTRPSNRRPPKLEPGLISSAGPITPGKLADESQLGGLTSLLSSSLSPPTTPLNTSPPLPTAITTPAPPKKRFLLQTRAKHCGEETHSLSESDEAPDRNTKKNFNKNKKKYKNKKSSKFQKNKRNWKTKWNDSLSRKLCQESSRNGPAPWKSENGCTQQQLIEKIVDSSFDAQKQFQEFAVQRTLDYINTEHTYQKNPSRFLQQQKQLKGDKKDDCLSLPILTKGDGANRNIITPNLNNNTIILPETRHDEKNRLSYSFNDNNNLIIDYVEPNQRKLDQSSIQTNHDRMKTSKVDGYIPGGKKGCVEKLRKDCDNSKRLEDQKKPLRIAQDENEDYAEEDNEGDDYDDDDGDGDDGDHLYEDYQDGDNNEDEDDGNDGDDDGGDDEDEDEEEDDEQAEEEEENDRVDLSKNCDRNNAEFQSILGKVSREIVNMIKERGPHNAEDMAVARFNVRSRSETDSDGSWYEKSDGSQPESPGGRRSKRSCKGQRYEQFIKDSVSKKRSKNSNLYTEVGNGGKKRVENRSKKRKAETIEALQLNNERAYVEKITEFLHKEKEFADKSKVYPETNSHTSEDLIIKQGTKASDIIQLKLDLELKLKKQGDDKCSRRNKDSKTTVKKKPVSKVQMIKEKREMHVGEFNLNEKIEELPLLSFESFLQKKRQRKKRLLGLKKDGTKSKIVKNHIEKLRERSPSVPDPAPIVPNKPTLTSGQSNSKPDFADLTTLAETALTLLSLREPR